MICLVSNVYICCLNAHTLVIRHVPNDQTVGTGTGTSKSIQWLGLLWR